MRNHSYLANHFHQIRYLTAGGLADIFLANVKNSDQIVVIKKLKDIFRNDEKRWNKFRNEAVLQSCVNHPNVVRILDYFEIDGQQYIIQEYVEGITLWNLLQTSKKNHPDLVKSIGLQICCGVAAVHRSEIIHCDIKPLNFLITINHILKLTDFGEARKAVPADNSMDEEIVWGSPLYMSPELSDGIYPKKTTDVYSIGIILYQIFVGKLPFFSNDAEEVIRMHHEMNASLPSDVNPPIHPYLEKIILKSIEKNPSNRFSDAEELLHEYERWAEHPVYP
ncbi:serine/threonine-protein kinase [Flexilinea flocculi]|jgi:serine/threonine protein kinase|uniref:Protein containing protein kinase domain n=1 Tax=Flexilinea flocculi TaxID=1678840 RepID=A0A0S7BUC1_9CHLR|nr:serine/threonine-protein kinase [Flexilinea flocculi]NMB94422.1 serine/threonine protein kinase [Flexilinea flocculi]GAP40502.1 protein containing protein kinase domain [Flexilinea flocculi]